MPDVIRDLNKSVNQSLLMMRLAMLKTSVRF